MQLEVLSDTALRQLEPARLMALITHVQRFIDNAVAYQRRLIAVAESQRASRAVGDACVADTLVRNTGMSRGAARRAARQAKTISARPEVAGALACGDINTDQAEAIARADVGDQTRRELVAAALSEGTDATRERAAAAETAARNETPEQRFMRQHANRFLRFYNNRDGMVCLEGALDPDSGARLKAKVSAIANRMWRTDKQQPPSQRRTPEQRDIDALCAATCRSSRPRPDGSASNGERPSGPVFHTPNERQRGRQPDRSVAAISGSRGQNTNGGGSRAEEPSHPNSGGTEPSRGAEAETTECSNERGRTAGVAGQAEPVEARTRAAGARDCATADTDSEDLHRNDPEGGHLGSSEPQSQNPDRNHPQSQNPDRDDPQSQNPDRNHPQSQNPDRDDPADGGWADYDDEGKRVLPVLRVSTSLDALLEGLHRAGITDSGESLSAATLRRMACDAEIIPTVLNSEGRVIDVGRRTRRVSEALRCVLIARDGGCVWPGCDAPPSRCDAHHIKHWANGGPTNADNLALLCHRHHILLHEGRHRLKRVDDAWVVLKPDGKPLHTPLAAPGGNNGSGRLRADDPITSCWPHSGGFPNLETAATTTTATVTKTTAAATPRPSRTPSAGLETAAYTARSAAILDVDPTKRSTDGAAQTPPRQLTLACGGRNELTVRFTAAELRDDKVQTGPTVGCGDSRGASHARTAPPVPVANRRPNPRSLTSPSAQNPSPILVTPRYHRFGWPGGAL